MLPKITKTQIKIITIHEKYSYRIMLVQADKADWLEARPISKGIIRTAENMQILKIILENDALALEREEQKQKQK